MLVVLAIKVIILVIWIICRAATSGNRSRNERNSADWRRFDDSRWADRCDVRR
jgi:hypothetical protein